MSYVFFGTPYVARDTLALLVERGFSPALVVTSPDARRGRGMVLSPSETKVLAESRSLPVFAPEKLDAGAFEAIAAAGAEYAVVVAYGKIFPQKLIDLFPKGVINIHYSLLPKYRGASPVEAALLHGDTATGVSLQLMQKELDAGDLLAVREVPIGPGETTRELRPRLILEGADLLASILPAFGKGELRAVPQEHAAATYAGKIRKEDGLLDLSENAAENWNKYRAYAESPGTYFYASKGGKQVRVKLRSAKYENGIFVPDRIVPEGKKETAYSDFIRG